MRGAGQVPGADAPVSPPRGLFPSWLRAADLDVDHRRTVHAPHSQQQRHDPSLCHDFFLT